ncbi:Subversion of eukaryotic traffic protein A [Xenorhabdus beddingii]|uniref:Subversion of eukaryotic traffic protein A n=1 Tax=Xenorhabdus beddingii TaxID=40578 RepID=A0A1Y2SQZ9_9GAMM|nr:glycosyltransferase [Xenorhabdus beddingii]OTA20552.1 Subversion of eukaryotic traffic protein A [Xenorhabdus beddingii]
MQIPKKIHYFWYGNNIPEKFLRNMIEIQYANPGYEVNIWGDNNSKTLIMKTLRNIKFKHHNASFDIGEISVNFTYRNVESAFRYLSQQVDFLSTNQLSTLNCFRYFKRRKQENNNKRRYGDHVDLVNYLQHIYRINLKGNYHNYASSSDLARLVILYMEGGIYLDTDVELSDADIKNRLKRKGAIFDNLHLQSDIGIGDSSGLGWYSGVPYNEFGNAIIASLPQSKKILNMLLDMAIMIKKHHLSIQMYQSPKSDEICKIKKLNRYHEVDKRIDLAIKLKNAHQINLDMRCGIQDPIWRTGIDPNDDNDEFACKLRRIDYTVRMTGPDFIDDYLNPQQKIDFPDNYKLKSKNRGDRMFKDVDDAGEWANIKKKKYPDEDPFT